MKTSGKLQPWLAQHGLHELQGLSEPPAHRTRLGKCPLEAALRERMARWKWGLDVQCRGSAAQDKAPPARLSFTARPLPRCPGGCATIAATGLGASGTVAARHDVALQALLTDWLQVLLRSPLTRRRLAVAQPAGGGRGAVPGQRPQREHAQRGFYARLRGSPFAGARRRSSSLTKHCAPSSCFVDAARSELARAE